MISKLNLLFVFSIVLAFSWMRLLQAKELGRDAYVSQALQGSGQRLQEEEFAGAIDDSPSSKGGVILADEPLELQDLPVGDLPLPGRAKRDKKAQRVTPDGCSQGWVRHGDGQCRKKVSVSPHAGPVKDRTG